VRGFGGLTFSGAILLGLLPLRDCTAESEGGAGGGDGAAGAQLPGSSHTPVLLLKRTRSNLGSGNARDPIIPP
jgi:hypothetical protein